MRARRSACCREGSAVRRDSVLDVAADDVARLIDEAYGLVTDRVDVVSGEAATVSRVSVQGRDYAAKISQATVDEAAHLRWQAAVVEHLADARLPVAGLVPDVTGSLTHQTSLEGAPVVVQLSHWLTDPPLGEVPVDRRLLHEVGRTAREVHRALMTAPRPPHEVSHPWELSRSADSIREARHEVADPRTRELADAAVQVFDATIGRQIDSLPRALVHHDLHDSNLLVGRGVEGGPAVSGILDFDDMVVGLRIAELSVAAVYAARHCDDPVGAYVEAVAGWGPDVELSEAEISCLFPAGMARMAVNATVWASRFGGPRGDYARQRSAASVRALEHLTAADHDAVTERIAQVLRPR